MNPIAKYLKSLVGGGPPPQKGRLPPVPLGWKPGSMPPGMRTAAGSEAATGAAAQPPAPQVEMMPPPMAVTATPRSAMPPAPVPPPAPAREPVMTPSVAPAPTAGLPTASAQATPLDAEMMRRALALAREAIKLGEVPVGAVVYETGTGKVLGEGYNRREVDHDPTAHAELIAIHRAAQACGDWRLNHCTLVVTLEPCPMCAGLVVNARLGRLVFGARDPKAGAVETLFHLTTDPRLNHRVTPIAGVLADDCARLLSGFFKGVRAKTGPRAEA